MQLWGGKSVRANVIQYWYVEFFCRLLQMGYTLFIYYYLFLFENSLYPAEL